MALKHIIGRGGWCQVLMEFLRFILVDSWGQSLGSFLKLEGQSSRWRPEFGVLVACIFTEEKAEEMSSKTVGGDCRLDYYIGDLTVG